MKRLSTSGRIISAVAAFALLLSIAAGAFVFVKAGVTHAASPNGFVSHAIKVSPKYIADGTANGTPRLSCQTPGAPVRCYAPRQIRTAYDIQRVLDAGDKGQGSTIVIIDAFQSPTIQQDLDLFDATFGIANTTVHIIAPKGLTPFNPNDPNQIGWAGEITLDVEWSHAIAPAATIDLVLAPSNQDADLLSVTQYAVDKHLGNVISQSFGEAESCADRKLLVQEHTLYAQAVKKGITLFASSGDQGAAQPTCDGSSYFLSASTPASDPYVTSVGATYLNANTQTGRYYSESAWNDSFGASGGGFSSIYTRPSYQSGFINNSQRGIPDAAYDGDINGGVLTVWSTSGQGANLVFIFGGTSAGSPQWAGMLALVNTVYGSQGNINPLLYRGFSQQGNGQYFHDITVGTNTFTGAGSNGQTVTVEGYNTHRGWDAVTGLGTLDLGNTILGPAGTNANSIHFWKN
jgi:subtilase family serine protease